MISDNEKNLINFVINQLENVNDNLIIDVGARIGNWTNILIEHFPNSNFICFEPDIVAYEILLNQYKNKSNIKVFNYGIGDEDKKEEYNFVKNAPGHSSFVMRPHFNVEQVEKREIDVFRIDNILNEKISYLKIDTEGYEYNVLKGASELLKNKKIEFIQFEYGGTFREIGVKLTDVIAFLNNYDYSVYEIINDKPKAILSYVDDYQYNNFIATKYNL